MRPLRHATAKDNPRISTPPLAIQLEVRRDLDQIGDKEEEDVEYMTESKTNVEISGSEEGEYLAAPQPTPPAPPRMQSHLRQMCGQCHRRTRSIKRSRLSKLFALTFVFCTKLFAKEETIMMALMAVQTPRTRSARFTSAAVSSNTIDSTLSRPSVRRSSSKGNRTRGREYNLPPLSSARRYAYWR